ncbi:YjbD family protein, partial [Vibrio sp.]|nr:YjbD family protein [Vibrio sp.]
MRIDRVEISGFRGISRLSLSFDHLTTLIGENLWGKSSLLDALTIMLPTNASLYKPSHNDFHVDHALSHPPYHHFQIIIRFVTEHKEERSLRRYRKIKPVWIKNQNNESMILYRFSATRIDNAINSHYAFLDAQGETLQLHDQHKLAQELMTLHPIIRLQDARHSQENSSQPFHERLERRLHNTSRRLVTAPGMVNKGEMKSSLNTLKALVEHYFSVDGYSHLSEKDKAKLPADHSDQHLTMLIQQAKNKQSRLLLLSMMNAYLLAKGPT